MYFFYKIYIKQFLFKENFLKSCENNRYLNFLSNVTYSEADESSLTHSFIQNEQSYPCNYQYYHNDQQQ